MTRYQQYFQASKDYFWQWEDNTEVLAIPGENTIAYREFVIDVLEKLSDQGVPPFGSLLLAIIATNPQGSQSIDTVYSILCRAIGTSDSTMLAGGMMFLKSLAKIPHPYKEGEKRLLLLQAIFQDCHNIFSKTNSKKILEAFKTNQQLDISQVAFSQSYFKKDFYTLTLLNNKFPNVESIISKIAALPIVTEPILLEEQQGDKHGEKDLVDQLIENAKTVTVGTLIKRIWSGLNIPVHSALPSQQPLGGVSDLTNKGDFDRLLISEFANEDILFLSRLANSEALYIHREVPPINNNLQRIILIDASLKNWGTPKTVAFAIMLAIANHPKTDIDCTAFIVGDNLHPISIKNIDDIIDGLQILESCLDASKGLLNFFHDARFKQQSEIFLITECTTVKYASVQKVLDDHRSSLHYLILTDTDGNVDVYKRSRNSQKHLQHIQLPLQELWKEKLKDLPSANNIRSTPGEIPLLFRTPGLVKHIIVGPNKEVFKLTSDHDLFKFHDNSQPPLKKGWELIRQNVPAADTVAIGHDNKGDLVIFLYKLQDRSIILFHVATGEYKKMEYHYKSKNPVFIFHEEKFINDTGSGIWGISYNGDILGMVQAHPDLFTLKDKEQKVAAKAHSSNAQIFKNINKVYINDTHRLTLNVHQLALSSQGNHLKLTSASNSPMKIGASPSQENEFVFQDGSSIEVIRAGMLILKSSDASIPLIFVPTALDVSLGVATPDVFAGNEYYRKNRFYEISIQMNETSSILLAIKLTKEALGIGLQEAQKIFHLRTTVELPGIFDQEKANHIKILFETNGFKTLVNAKGHNNDFHKAETMEIQAFYRKYVDAFINNILRHAANH